MGFIEDLQKELFGTTRKDGICVTCRSTKVKPEDFREVVARREYQISGMCQACQDEVFLPRREDE